MNMVSKFLNFAVDKNQLLHSFSYSNASVLVTLESGTCISGALKSLFVDFEKINGSIVYTIKGNGKQLSFYQTSNITNKEWDAINGVLCLAGETRGRSIFSQASKTVGYINFALKAIKSIT